MAIWLPGINIQQPWSQLLLDGKKTVETRTYPLPLKYMKKPLWLIETPGAEGDRTAVVVGIIAFSTFKIYRSRSHFRTDFEKHLVPVDHPLFGYRPERKKYGWEVLNVMRIAPFEPTARRGIVYTTPFRAPTSAIKKLDVERMFQ